MDQVGTKVKACVGNVINIEPKEDWTVAVTPPDAEFVESIESIDVDVGDFTGCFNMNSVLQRLDTLELQNQQLKETINTMNDAYLPTYILNVCKEVLAHICPPRISPEFGPSRRFQHLLGPEQRDQVKAFVAKGTFSYEEFCEKATSLINCRDEAIHPTEESLLADVNTALTMIQQIANHDFRYKFEIFLLTTYVNCK